MASLEVTLRSGDRTAAGTLSVREIASGERAWRVARTAVLCLVAIGVSLVIPGLHFVLAPIALVSSVVLIGRSARGGSWIESGAGQCPGCGAEFRVLARAFKLPVQDVCEQCHRQVVVEARAAKGG